MSLLAKRIGLIFISALIFFSCNKEKETVGLQLNPQNNSVGTFYTDTFSFKTAAVLKNDAIKTSTQDYAYVGAYHDAMFGDVYAEAYNQILLKYENINTSAGVVDSVVMNLVFDYYYGDTTNLQTVNVSNLASAIPSTDLFSISPALASGAIVDTDASFYLRPLTSKTVKVMLNNSWGEDILHNKNGAGGVGGTGTSNADFKINFPGIAIKPKEISGSGLGAIFRVKLLDNSSTIKIYYKIDAVVQAPFELILTSSGTHFSKIIGGASTHPVLSNLVTSGDQTEASGEIFLQSGLGIRTKIEFPYLSNFKDALGNVAINRAELIFEPSDVNPTGPIGALHLLKLNSSGEVLQYLSGSTYKDQEVQADLFDVKGTTSPLVAYYSTSSNTVTMNISTYLHALLYGEEENNGLIIEADPFVSSTSVNRTYVESSKVKLKVYYTKID